MPQAVALVRTVKGSLPDDPAEFWEAYAEIKAFIGVFADEIVERIARTLGDGGTV